MFSAPPGATSSGLMALVPVDGPVEEKYASRFVTLAGFATSIAVMVVAALVLYVIFKRKDWL